MKEYHVKSMRPDHISPVIIEGEELDVALQVVEQLRLGYTRIEITVKELQNTPNEGSERRAPARSLD